MNEDKQKQLAEIQRYAQFSSGYKLEDVSWLITELKAAWAREEVIDGVLDAVKERIESVLPDTNCGCDYDI